MPLKLVVRWCQDVACGVALHVVSDYVTSLIQVPPVGLHSGAAMLSFVTCYLFYCSRLLRKEAWILNLLSLNWIWLQADEKNEPTEAIPGPLICYALNYRSTTGTPQ